MCNWYLFIRPRKDERHSRPRRNSTSEPNNERNTAISPGALKAVVNDGDVEKDDGDCSYVDALDGANKKN